MRNGLAPLFQLKIKYLTYNIKIETIKKKKITLK